MAAIPHRCEKKGGGWTLDTLQEHWETIRASDAKFMQERDRRYLEVTLEREKAIKIKEEADKAALGLAREIQTYKDEKANQLREQISSERGSFATKSDLDSSMREISARIDPLVAFVSGAASHSKGLADGWGYLVGLVSMALLAAELFFRR